MDELDLYLCVFSNDRVLLYDLLAGNKARTKVLPSANTYRTHLGNQFNHILLC